MWAIIIFSFITAEGYISGVRSGGYVFQRDSLLYIFNCVMGLDSFPLYLIDLNRRQILDKMYIRKGNGPGELRSIYGFKGFFGDGDSVYVFDGFKKSIMIFSIANKAQVGEIVTSSKGKLAGKYGGKLIFSQSEGVLIGNKFVKFLNINEKNELKRRILKGLDGLVFLKKDSLFWIHPVLSTLFGYDLKKKIIFLQKKGPGKMKGDVKVKKRGRGVIAIPDPNISSFVVGENSIYIFRNSPTDEKERYLITYNTRSGKFKVEKAPYFISLAGFFDSRIFYFKNDTLYFSKPVK